MARKFETDYRIAKTSEILPTENKFRLDVDLRLDAVELALQQLGSGADTLVARVLRAIETEISPRAAEIEALLANYREGVPASAVQEEADGRQFLTPTRRAALLEELRGGVDVSHDTLAKLLAYMVAVDAAKAPAASPAFTGVPTAPTAPVGTNNSQLANTAFVATAIAALKGSAPEIYDTLGEIAAWIASDTDAEAAITAQLATKASIASVTAAARIGSTVWSNTSAPLPNTLVEDGASYSSSAYPELFAVLVKHASVTLTLGASGVVTWTGHGRKANDPIKFTTTGALPTGLTAGTTYYVVGTGLTSNTFQVSGSPGSAAIGFSGAQSGTQTAICAPHGCANDLSSFSVPNTLGEFVRAWDGGRGIDLNRVIGSGQLDAMQGHVHRQMLSTINSGVNNGPVFAATGAANVGGLYTAGPESDGTNGTPRVAPETRPRNVTKLPCIVYQ